ncbi:MAG: TniQ family protein [Betaproteobacteria bacterium]|nr:TniQ family protein [Betaproteobacteria bacterium]
MALLVRPDPFDDESPLGYLLRLIDLNGLVSGNHLLDLIAVEGRRWRSLWAVATRPQGMMDLAIALGKPVEPYRQLAYTRSNSELFSTCLFKGSQIPRWALRVKRSHVCVVCLRASAHARAVWDLSLVEGCPQHNIRLIDACPHCHSALRMARQEVATCGSCGFDLRLAEGEPLTTVESDRLRLILHALAGPHDRPNMVGEQVISKGGWLALLAFLWRSGGEWARIGKSDT